MNRIKNPMLAIVLSFLVWSSHANATAIQIDISGTANDNVFGLSAGDSFL